MESIQMLMMFSITIIATIGIVSAVVYFSKDSVNFNIKFYSKFFSKSESRFSINVSKKAKKENR